jgi:hypothetical protein
MDAGGETADQGDQGGDLRGEAARLIDRSFVNWEIRRECPAVLGGILRTHESEEARMAPTTREAAVLAPSAVISDCPLPLPLPQPSASGERTPNIGA